MAKLAINKEFAINAGTSATIGKILVVHSTDNVGATARNGAIYENRVWRSAQTFVHFFVDDTSIYQVGTPGYKAWGAGNVNKYAPVQIELCEFRDKTRSLNAYKNFVVLIQELAPKYGIPLTLDDSNRTAGIKSHAWCSQNYGGSDHQDPYPWLTSIGISKAQFLADIKGKAVAPSAPTAKPSKSVAQVANEVINGLWGSGSDRNSRLMDAGYNASAIQTEVNRILAGVSSPKPSLKTTAQVAQEVINGKWGSGADRTKRLTASGYNATAVQAEVNRLLGATTSKPSAPQIKEDGYLGPATFKLAQRLLGIAQDGIAGVNTWKGLQRAWGVPASQVDGKPGPNTYRYMQRHYGTPVDGKLSSPSIVVKAFQRALNAGKI